MEATPVAATITESREGLGIHSRPQDKWEDEVLSVSQKLGFFWMKFKS